MKAEVLRMILRRRNMRRRIDTQSRSEKISNAKYHHVMIFFDPDYHDVVLATIVSAQTSCPILRMLFVVERRNKWAWVCAIPIEVAFNGIPELVVVIWCKFTGSFESLFLVWDPG